MKTRQTDALDRKMMTRCISLSVRSGEQGEYPYGVVIRRADQVVTETTNRVAHEHDVTRHAEVVAISQAQKALGVTSLDDCMIYVNAEPCASCAYATRESRIARVIYGLRGVSKWNVLADTDLSNTMPEVFAPPPTGTTRVPFLADKRTGSFPLLPKKRTITCPWECRRMPI